ncbi:peptidase C14, caspase domain-containing protein [Irpex rosettiformis]|uniref:Peptidase C14, caspase domain-containing protein n=1 Tax=Irpex rosettiformis TaxID=378272 RepID=A0ACB8U7Z0_9APHY|nr:peptidase C14, caspase domain-containing protein [Irpex rosettiformis]
MSGSPQRRTQPVKKALSIAVSYSDRSEYKIEYVHKDSDLIVDLLKETFGYPPENITVMKDDGRCPSQPTRNNILQAMRDLVSNTIPGDHLVYHISGHGSQRDCPIKGQEEDGKDELFWPLDVELEHGDDVSGNYILDDKIKDILVNGLQPGVNLVLIADCCHSGTMAENERSKLAPDNINQPESPVAESGEEEGIKRRIPNVVCWSACMDDQETYNPFNAGGENIEQTHQELLHNVT